MKTTLVNRLLVKLGIHGKSHAKKDEQILDEIEVMGLGCSRNPRNIHKVVPTSGIEVNGPANIIMTLQQMVDMHDISISNYLILIAEAEKTLNYMKQLDNPNHIKWHDVK